MVELGRAAVQEVGRRALIQSLLSQLSPGLAPSSPSAIAAAATRPSNQPFDFDTAQFGGCVCACVCVRMMITFQTSLTHNSPPPPFQNQK